MTRPGAEPHVAVITGASSGIGYELAQLFARDGYQLVLVGRDAEKLRQMAQQLQERHRVVAHPVALDLAGPGAAAALEAELARRQLPADVLVNNAGVALWGEFAMLSLSEQLRMVQLNVLTLTELTRRLLPAMLSRGRGRILNVASTAAFQPGPMMAAYYASKAYVLSFSEALANELERTGVTVTALCPGPTATQFEARAGIGGRSRFFQNHVMNAATVARAGYEGLRRGRAIVIPGLRNQVLIFCVRLLPRSLVTRMVRKGQDTRP